MQLTVPLAKGQYLAAAQSENLKFVPINTQIALIKRWIQKLDEVAATADFKQFPQHYFQLIKSAVISPNSLIPFLQSMKSGTEVAPPQYKYEIYNSFQEIKHISLKIITQSHAAPFATAAIREIFEHRILNFNKNQFLTEELYLQNKIIDLQSQFYDYQFNTLCEICDSCNNSGKFPSLLQYDFSLNDILRTYNNKNYDKMFILKVIEPIVIEFTYLSLDKMLQEMLNNQPPKLDNLELDVVLEYLNYVITRDEFIGVLQEIPSLQTVQILMINHFDVRNYLLLVVEFNNTEQIIFPKIADSLDDCSNFLTHVEIGKINLIKDLFTKYFESYVGDINFAEYCGCCAKDIHNINLETILLNLAGFYLKFGQNFMNLFYHVTFYEDLNFLSMDQLFSNQYDIIQSRFVSLLQIPNTQKNICESAIFVEQLKKYKDDQSVSSIVNNYQSMVSSINDTPLLTTQQIQQYIQKLQNYSNVVTYFWLLNDERKRHFGDVAKNMLKLPQVRLKNDQNINRTSLFNENEYERRFLKQSAKKSTASQESHLINQDCSTFNITKSYLNDNNQQLQTTLKLIFQEKNKIQQLIETKYQNMIQKYRWQKINQSIVPNIGVFKKELFSLKATILFIKKPTIFLFLKLQIYFQVVLRSNNALHYRISQPQLNQDIKTLILQRNIDCQNKMSQLNSVKLILLHLNEIIRYDTHVLKLKICSQLVINIFTRIIKTLQEQFQLQYIQFEPLQSISRLKQLQQGLILKKQMIYSKIGNSKFILSQKDYIVEVINVHCVAKKLLYLVRQQKAKYLGIILCQKTSSQILVLEKSQQLLQQNKQLYISFSNTVARSITGSAETIEKLIQISQYCFNIYQQYDFALKVKIEEVSEHNSDSIRFNFSNCQELETADVSISSRSNQLNELAKELDEQLLTGNKNSDISCDENQLLFPVDDIQVGDHTITKDAIKTNLNNISLGNALGSFDATQYDSTKTDIISLEQVTEQLIELCYGEEDVGDILELMKNYINKKVSIEQMRFSILSQFPDLDTQYKYQSSISLLEALKKVVSSELI